MMRFESGMGGGWISSNVAILACVAGMTFCSASVADDPVLSVSITDGAGRPVPRAEAYLIETTYRMPLSKFWQAADDNGVATFGAGALDADFTNEGEPVSAALVVRAPGRAWSTSNVTLPSSDPVKVVLDSGRFVEIALIAPQGAPLPADTVPIIFTEGQSVCAWLTAVQRHHAGEGANSVFSAATAQHLGDGRFGIHVPEECEQIWVLVNHAGYLRAFQAGPFDVSRSNTDAIEIALPRAGSLSIHVAPDETTTHAYDQCGIKGYLSPEIPDGGWSFVVESRYSALPTLEAEISDLAPGLYSFEATTGDRSNMGNLDRPDYFSVHNGVDLKAEAHEDLNFAMQTFDESAQRARLKGDHSLTVKVTHSDGRPAAGKEYALSFSLPQFGRHLDITSGTLPESGEFTVNDLPSGRAAYLGVQIDHEDAGYVFIKEDEPSTVYEVSVAPAVGDMAPDIVLTRLDTGSTFALSSLRGQVVFIDFWASWCGPCQEPMAHNDSIMARHAGDWKGKAVIIGASIDNGIDIIRDHIDKHPWTNVLQAFCGEGEPGWKCEAAKKYAVRAVPSAYLIDRDGKIAWTGHPASIDPEQEIEALLARQR